MVQACKHIVRSSPVSATRVDTVSAPFKRLLGGTEYILSRRFCSYRSKAIDGIKPSGEMIRAAILEASTASSYADPSAFVTVAGGILGVWTWDNRDLERGLPPSARRQAVPETLYHRPVEGFALRSCIEGVEGQWWQSGVLMASRWWSEEPSLSEWALFKRAVGVPGDQEEFTPPEITQGFDANVSRPRSHTPLSDRFRLVSPPEIAVLLAGCLTIPAIYFAVSAVDLGLEHMSLQNQKLDLQTATAGRAELNRDISDMRRQLSSYQGLFRTNDPLSSLQAAILEIVKREGEVQRLSFEDGELSVQFETKGDLSERDFVSALEATATLNNVSLRKQGDSNVWTIDASATSNGGRRS